MSGGGGQLEIEILCQLQETVKLVLGQVLGPEADIVINVALSFQIATKAVSGAAAGRPRVLDARLWRSLSPENPSDGPDETLGAQGGTAIPEGQRGVNEKLVTPPEPEEHGLDWVDGKPSIPPGHVNLPHDKACPGVSCSRPLNGGDDGVTGR